MGGETLHFAPAAAVREQIELLREQNEELRNSNRLLGKDMDNGLSGVVAGAQSQFNITNFNPLFQSNIFSPITINFTFLTYFYKTHGIIQRAIQMPVQDALRGGVDFHSKQMNEENIDEFNEFLEGEGIWETIENAMTWARLFGGAALVINDGGDFAKPLEDDAPLRHLQIYAASRWELGSPERLENPDEHVTNLSPWETGAALSSEHYFYYGKKIHKSRVITLSGKEAPWMVRWMLQGWGMSEVERMVEPMNLFIRETNVLYDLMNEAKVDVFMIDGLRELLITAGGDQKLLRRMTTVQQSKNMNNALLLDKNDEYQQKQLTFTGIAEVMKEIKMQIASSLGMPISKIFGVASSGFSSGEDDIENYNALVESDVRGRLRKPMRRVFDICQRFLWGSAMEYRFKFKPLRVMSAKDEEDVKEKKFNRTMAAQAAGLMTSVEWGEAAHKDETISVDTLAAQGKLEDFPAQAQQEKEMEMQSDNDKQSKESKEK